MILGAVRWLAAVVFGLLFLLFSGAEWWHPYMPVAAVVLLVVLVAAALLFGERP